MENLIKEARELLAFMEIHNSIDEEEGHQIVHRFKEQLKLFEELDISPNAIAILRERWEQIHIHNRTVEKDIKCNKICQLSQGASMLALDYPIGCLETEDVIEYHCPANWDKSIWEKMAIKNHEKRLVLAGALIIAELDRLENQ